MLFHDDRWVIRYLVVDTGKWLPGRKVLISPISVEAIESAFGRVVLHLDKERIRQSPDISADEPVSRQKEAEFHAYYGYGPYWAGPGVWGPAVYPRELRPLPHEAWPAAGERASKGDPHLRSTREVIGYHIAASDGTIGHLDDFVIDEALWTVRHLVVDTSNWPGGRSVLVSPVSVRAIDWVAKQVQVNLPMERIRTSSEYIPAELLR
jgi:sporulation protein YlmC with PRC-barrel domain